MWRVLRFAEERDGGVENGWDERDGASRASWACMSVRALEGLRIHVFADLASVFRKIKSFELM